MKKDETITVRVTSDVKSKLIELAKNENRSMANMIETLVLQAHDEKMKVEETKDYCIRCGAQNVLKQGDLYRCFSCNEEWNEDEK